MKIPQRAKKVFEGVIFDVWHWEQEMFDGTTKTFEALTRPDTAVIIPLIGDKMYIQNEEQPGMPPELGFPAGRFDPGESDPLLVAKRELLEETGYTSDDFILFRSFPSEGKIISTVHIVVARNVYKVSEPSLDGGEKIHDTKLVTFDEFLELATDQKFSIGKLQYDCFRALRDPAFKEEFRKSIFDASSLENTVHRV